ncbi:MAG: transcription termination factor Rho [Planctomycetaceae bacterium]|jgi:transcription termination factor Rho|nr:transcription termination factor Rho [Planctomycetaceae bacterium]MBT6485972.1 transcription termination factor Rho [Planctomycetaceae bacterium]MBT6497052.1 transcription termination factor Rho [Planctomycetaceae bacterium]
MGSNSASTSVRSGRRSKRVVDAVREQRDQTVDDRQLPKNETAGSVVGVAESSSVVLADDGGGPPRSNEGGGRPKSGDGSGGGSTTGRRRRRRRRRGGGGGGGEGDARNKQGGSRNNRSSRSRRPQTKSQNGEEVTGTIEGVLELHPKGYGFLRDPKKNYIAQGSDAFVSSSHIEKHNLREGILIRGEVGSGSRDQGPRLKTIETIDGRTLEEYQEIKLFDELTPVNPCEQIRLERGAAPITMRVMDLLTPIGKGQRALIVAPPRTGKTLLMQDIADSVSENHPEVELIVLLIDERPEEVTEMQRRIKGEVVASSMDREVESHIRLSQLIIERGKRLAEAGKDVFILLDSITRTARAFNKWVGNTGRTMSGGLDVKALDIPKKMFGTARRFDEGGSLTVVATALIDTGSRMDEVIFQEFKGTGNMEMVLSRELADRRIWPAIDIQLSGTRREELILEEETLDSVVMLRRSLVSLSTVEAMEQLISTLKKFPTNAEFLKRIRAVL